jgi:hypothetical protein
MRDTEDHIQRAIDIGEKNKRVIGLIQNWCANVTVKKWGGGGLVEAETGLPIGPRMLECPHAAASGMAGVDLTFIAIDFYDRNCSDCKFRKPVNIPNLKELIDERDSKRAQQNQAQKRAERELADRLEAREAHRRELRLRLGTMAATTLDLISELDRTRETEAATRLVQTAELAPETFSPEITEHLFSLIASNEYWLAEPCLECLHIVEAEPKRLCNTALEALCRLRAREVAAKIIDEHCQDADEELLCKALPELIDLATPPPSRFGMGSERIVTFPDPLKKAFSLQPAALKRKLKELLEQRDSDSVRTAARGLTFLEDQDASLPSFLAAELAAKLARAKWLIEGRDPDEIDFAMHDVRHALVRALLAEPIKTDSIIISYLEGATPQGAKELYHVYREILWITKRPREDLEITDAHRIAFKRIVNAATHSDIEEVSDAARQLFHGAPYELTPLAGEEIDLLLGSAAIISQKLKEFESDQRNVGKDFLSAMERVNRRQSLVSLENSFVQWACTAAGRLGPAAIEKVLSVLRNIPEENDSLRAAIVRNFDEMMVSADSLSICLPHYYTALVGSSQLVRARAAEALGEMRVRILKDLPMLVFEAFTALMTDNYLIVHQAAVTALQRFELPNDYNASAKEALRNLIMYYAPRSIQDSSNARFLLKAIDLYANRYSSEEAREGRLGDQLITILKRLQPSDVADELRYATRSLRKNAHYGELMVRLLSDERAMSLHHDDLIGEIGHIPAGTMFKEREAAVKIARDMGPRYPALVGAMIEGLSAAGAWKEALDVATEAYARIEDTTRTRPMRLHAAVRRIACSYEAAVASGQRDRLEGLSGDWKKTLTEIENDREANRRRRDPLFGLRG